MSRNKLFILLLLVLLLGNIPTFSQSTVWNSSLILNPNPSSFLSEWQREIRIGTFTLSYNGIPPVQFYSKLILTHSSLGQLISAKSKTQEFLSGPTTKIYAGPDIVDWQDVDFNASVQDVILRTGRLPEGLYDLEVKIYNLSGTLLTESSGSFNIVYPDPPQLILPQDQTTLTTELPVFQWNPVITPQGMNVNYKLKIVERLQGQNLNQAMTANVAQLETTIVNQGYYNYPADGLPLELGKEYIWQITARNDDGNPITSNEGKSELFSFNYFPPTIITQYPFQNISIIENRAYFSDYSGLQIIEDQSTYKLSGNTTLKIAIPGGGEYEENVYLTNWILTKTAPNRPPIVTTGSFNVSPGGNSFPSSFTGNYFKPKQIRYRAGEAMTMTGELQLPGISTAIPLTGEVEITSGGFYGDLLSSGQQFYTFDENNIRAVINQAAVEFRPNSASAKVKFNGSLNFFANSFSHEFNDLTPDNDGSLNANINFSPGVQYSPVPGQPVNFTINSVAGNCRFELQQNLFDYNLTLKGALTLPFSSQNVYTNNLTLELNKASGLSLAGATGSNTPLEINLDFFKLLVTEPRLTQFTYTNNNWDFKLLFNGQPVVPPLGNLTLPVINDLTLENGGLLFQPHNSGNLQANTPGKKLLSGGVELDFKQVDIPQFGLNWMLISGGNAAGLNLGLNFELNFPNFPEGTAIALKNLKLPLSGTLRSAGFSVEIQPIVFPGSGHKLPLSENINFFVKELSGTLSGQSAGSIMNLNPQFKVKGAVTLPSSFNCSSGMALVNIESLLDISPDGRLSGSAENVQVPCQLAVGQFTGTISSARFLFGQAGPVQKIDLYSGISLAVTGSAPLPASLIYDLITGDITSLNASLTSPFTLNFPKVNPVLSFTVNNAELNKAGLMINGRNSLKLGASGSIGCTFNNVRMPLNENAISAGGIILDNAVSMKAVINPEGTVYSILPLNSALQPGDNSVLMMDLPPDIVIDRNGFKITGESTGRLKYSGYDMQVGVQAVPGCTFSLDPFKVSSGSIQLLYNNLEVATIGPQGFILNQSNLAFSSLPENLTLPSQSIAYLKIKEGSTFLVNYASSDSGMHIWTAPGQTVKMVLPVFKFNRSAAPELNVGLDIYYDLNLGDLKSGSLTATVQQTPDSIFDFSKQELPFVVKNITYGIFDGRTKFKLTGNLKLFGEQIPSPLDLYVQDGVLAGMLNINSLNKAMQLVPGSQKVLLTMNSLAGEFNANLLQNDKTHEIGINSKLDIVLSGSQSYSLTGRIKVNQSGTEVEEFTPQSQPGNYTIGFRNFGVTSGNFSFDSLSYNKTSGWNFRISFAGRVNIPSFGIELPEVENFVITKEAFRIPAFSLANLQLPAVNYRGNTLKPLNARYNGVSFNWFDANANPENLDTTSIGFDFELQLTGLPQRFPQQIASAKSYITGARYSSGKMTGAVSENDFADSLTVSLPSGASVFLKGIRGSFADSLLNIQFPGGIVLPDTFRCENYSGIMYTQFSLDRSGLKGTTAQTRPECPIRLGPGVLNITEATVDYEITEGISKLILDSRGNLNLPPPSGSANVTVPANLKINVLDLKIVEGQISINKPFKWELPSVNPVFNFRIENAQINKDGFKISGNSSLSTGAATTAGVTFNDLNIDLVTGRLLNGSIKFNEETGLKILIGNGASTWSVISANAPLTDSGAIKINVPVNSLISKDGLPLRGQSTGSVRYQGSSYDSLSVFFSGDFIVDINPVAVKSGAARFMKGADTVGTLSSAGFVPANLLKKATLPNRIVFNNEAVAYLTLRRNDSSLVVATETQNGYRLNSVSGKVSPLVMPALKYGAGTNPEYSVTLTNILVDKSFERILEGTIQVTGTAQQPLLSLKTSGVPLKITAIRISPAQNNYNIFATGIVDLPGVLTPLNVRLDSLVVAQGGIAGNYGRGSYSQNYVPNASALSSAVLGSMMSVSTTGISAEINPATNTANLSISGDITTNFFKDSLGVKAPLHYTAVWNKDAGRFNFDIDNAPSDTLKIGKAKFRPVAIGGTPKISLSFAESMAEISVSGELIVPLLQDFRVSMSGLRIYTDRVAPPGISPVSPLPSFRMFNCRFEYSSISFQFDTSLTLLAMNTSGTVTFLNSTTPFQNLVIGGDGRIYGTPPPVLASLVYVVPNLVGFNSARIENDELVVEGFVKFLGATPVDTLRRYITFKLDRSGVAKKRTERQYLNNSYAGLAQITPKQNNVLDLVVYNRTSMASLSATDTNRCRRQVWKFLLDPVYMGIRLDFDEVANSYMQAVIDIWAKDSIDIKNTITSVPRKIARVGNNGGSISPGVTVYNSGPPTIGPITYFFSDTTTIAYQAFYIKITDFGVGILSAGDGYKYQISISGSMGIGQKKDTLKYKGSLVFSGLTVSTDYHDLANLPHALRGGTFVIAKVVNLSLSNIQYSATPKTLYVKGGEDGNLKAINVDWYFQFTAHVSIKDSLGTGGVDSLFVYRTGAGDIGIIVQNLTFSIKDKVKLNVDFEFVTEGSNFKFLLAGSAKIVNRINVVVVGKISTLNDKLSLGIFVAASGLAINISGNLYLTGLGGGFFYNPDASDKAKVLNKLSMVSDPQSRINSTNADFMVLVYAEITVTAGPPPTSIDDPKNLVRGKVLLCVTNAYLTLDGQVVILRQDNKIYGNFNFAVGWKDFFVDGNIDVVIIVPKLIEGTAKLRFFVYSSDSWGIIGAINGTLCGSFNVKANLFVGPPGFMFTGSIYQTINIKIISVSAGLDVKIWYLKDVSWGLYARAFIEASVLGGIVWVKGQLEAALLGDPDFYIYGVAELSASVLFIGSWTGSVWVKISSDGLDGGLGRDSEMDRLIAEATVTANSMEQAKTAATNTMNAQQAAQFAVSQAEIASAFKSMFTFVTQLNSPVQSDREFTLFVINNVIKTAGMEKHIPYAKTGEQSSNYNTLANNCVSFVIDSFYRNFPNDKADITQMNTTLQSRITAFNNQNRQVAGIINGIVSEQITAAAGTPFSGMTDPVSNLNVDTNTIVAATVIGGDGLNYKTVSSTPQFSFDAGTAQSNTNKLAAAQQNYAQYEQNMVNKINEVETRLRSIRQALISAQSGYRSVGNNYKLTLEAFENYYAAYLRSIRGDAVWAFSKQLSNALRNPAWYFFDQSNFASDFDRYCNNDANFFKRARESAYFCYSLYLYFSPESDAQKDIKRTQYWNSITTSTDRGYVRGQWSEKFKLMWYDIFKTGFENLMDTARVKIRAQILDYRTRISQLENTQESLSTSVDSLFAINIRLTELLYDIYNNYGYWKQNRPDSIKNKPITLSTINAKKDSLRNDMKVPQITALNYSATPKAAYDSLKISWSATHPTGIIDNEIKFLRTGQTFNGKFQSVGSNSTMVRKTVPYGEMSLTNWNSLISESATLYVRARGGAGYSNTRSVEVNLSFKPFEFGSLIATPQPASSSGGMPSDNTPPLISQIRVTSGQGYDFTADGTTYRKYAVSNGDGFSFDYSGSDPESGVIEYQYKILKASVSAASFNNVPVRTEEKSNSLRVLVENVQTSEVVGWTSTGGRKHESIPSIQLRDKTWYFLKVRAKNGDGLWCEEYYLTPFFVDATKPGTVNGMTAISSLKQYGNVYRPYISISSFSRAVSDYGIAKYYIRAVAIDNSYEATEWEQYDSTSFNSTVSIESEIFRRKTAYRVEFRAENKLGILGDARGFNITTAYSTVAPTNFSINVGESAPTVLKLNFVTHASSPQVGIAGYYIYLRKQNTSSDIFRTYLPVNAAQPQSTADVNLSGAVMSDGIYNVEIATLTADSVTSARSYVGRKILDQTPPAKPVFTASVAANSTTVTFSFSSLSFDGESGIKGYQAAIGNSAGDSSARNWNNGGRNIDFNPGGNNSASLNFSLNEISGSRYYSVRAMNEAGLVSQAYSVGPIEIDRTAPLGDAGGLEWVSNQNFPGQAFGVKCTLSNVKDLESGINYVTARWYKNGSQKKTDTKYFYNNKTLDPFYFYWSISSQSDYIKAGDRVKVEITIYNKLNLTKSLTAERTK